MARRSWRRAGTALAWFALVLTCALPVANGVVGSLGPESAASASAEIDRATAGVPAALDRDGALGRIAPAVHRWDGGTTRGRPALTGAVVGVAVLAALLVRRTTPTAQRANASHVPTASRGRAPPLAVLPG